MNKEGYLEKMISYKGLFMRAFFMCGECRFVWTTLGQATHEMGGACPSCGECDIDYAPEDARNKFVEGIKDELNGFATELEGENA